MTKVVDQLKHTVLKYSQNLGEFIIDDDNSMTADGSAVDTRDESNALPGFEDTNKPTNDTNTPDTNTTDTNTPDTNSPNEPSTKGETAETPDVSNKPVEQEYPIELKITIVLTGVVLGVCCFACIVVADFVKKKKK